MAPEFLIYGVKFVVGILLAFFQIVFLKVFYFKLFETRLTPYQRFVLLLVTILITLLMLWADLWLIERYLR